jgi:hypothetical protein
MSRRNPPPEPERVVSFTVPHLTPPSVNHYKHPVIYTGRDGYLHRGYKRGKEANAFYDAVAIFAKGRTVAPLTDSERRKVHYQIGADVWLGPHQRLDADNSGKVICDALQNARVIHSDAFVKNFQVTIHKDDRANPRTEIAVERLED